MEEIVNKVANSALMVFDLEDYYPDNHVIAVDVSQWLFGGVILKETELRAETIKKEKQLEAKERFVQLKSEYDRDLLEKNKKIGSINLKIIGNHSFKM